MIFDSSDVALTEYVTLLQSAGSLSKLFSDSQVPYLYYRVAENAFCRAYGAQNYSRSDTSADAGKNGTGIGLKTFLNNNGRSFQKIAEFNKNRSDYKDLTSEDSLLQFVSTISNMRNERIDFAKNVHGVNSMIYHCVTREKGRFILFEEGMDYISIDKIGQIKKKRNSIYFEDDKHEYNFNISKSTLLKRFITKKQYTFDVKIAENPFDLITKLNFNPSKASNLESVILPLYSQKTYEVQQRSGLNQWNAGGRARDPNEAYIQIPSWIHKTFPEFFPQRDKPFTIQLPDNTTMSAKVCQDGSKALMSKPNKLLGKWILRDILQLKEWELLTYERLERLGIDSVEITKIDPEMYTINFKELGSFDEFKKHYDSKNS